MTGISLVQSKVLKTADEPELIQPYLNSGSSPGEKRKLENVVGIALDTLPVIIWPW